MNANIKKMAKNRLNTTRLGRILRRFCSEESGQGAMEYVVLATLICAAIAVGIWLFGAQIGEMFGIAGHGVIGEHQVAEETLNNTVRPSAEAKDQTRVDADRGYTDYEAAKNTIK